MTWRQYGGNFDNPINPEYEQEARLVEQSRAGSERAFSALLARYQQPVFRLILYLVGDENEARDLARIAIKNALLHMPGVPAGYSIRPWLLRVAVLVALDAVRERSETPEELIASLQLPPPPGPPRIVDADPAESDTMVMHVSHLENLARNPEAAVADAWDELPIEIERELIRRLLAGLPEGDAELLALGVVGQIPTRDLAALAGTSQRSIRRRIARALILFQSRYTAVRLEELPPPPEKKELPPSAASATPSIPLMDRARRGLAEASDRVRRGIQSVRQQFTPEQAEERLQTLRTSDVPPAAIVPPSPDIPPATEEPSQPYQSYASSNTSPLNGPDTGPLSGEMDVIPPAPGTFEPHSYADWTVPAPELDVPDRPTIPPSGQVTHPVAPAVQDAPAADTVVLPPTSQPPSAMPGDAATVVAAPTDGTSDADATMALADVSQAATIVPPAAPPDSPSATNPGRVLPRYGPPPEDVVTDTVPRMRAVAEPAASTPAEPISEDAAAPVPDDTPALEVAPVPAEPRVTSGVWLEDADITGENKPIVAAESSVSASSGSAAATAMSDAPPEDIPIPNAAEPVAAAALESNAAPAADSAIEAATAAAADTVTEDMAESARDQAAEAEAEPTPEADEQPVVALSESAVDETPSAPPTELATPAPEASEAMMAESPPAASETDESPAAPVLHDLPVSEVTTAQTNTDDASVSEATANANAAPESVQTGTNLAEEMAEPPHAAADPDAALPEDAAPTEPPVPAVPDAGESPAVVAIERSAAAHPAPPISGSTVVIQPLARDDYLTRHRPSWLDGSDIGSIPGVTMTDSDSAAEPPAEPPTVPVLGAYTLPSTQLADHTSVAQPLADAVAPDLADLGDLTAPPVEVLPGDAPAPPAASLPPTRLRPPSRPMPHLEDDDPAQPQEQ